MSRDPCPQSWVRTLPIASCDGNHSWGPEPRVFCNPQPLTWTTFCCPVEDVAQLELLGSSGWVQPPLHSTFFFFFFFLVGQGSGSAAKTMKSQRGEMVSRPQHLTVLWSGAPSSGTTCSLELSLPSPAGIWFKTPLSVGDTNTLGRRQDLHQIRLLHAT